MASNPLKLTHGFPIATKFKGTEKDLLVRMTKTPGHATIIGATRSGKTARMINPLIQMTPYMEVKPSLVISDPKGELFETHSKHLQDNGYEIISINLRDESLSSKWNPLSSIWDKWFKYDLWDLKEDMKLLQKEGKKAEIKELDEKIFKAETSRDNAKEQLSALATVLFPNVGKDPIWSQGASSIFQFMVLSLLELKDYDPKITKDSFNINNIQANLNSTTYEDLSKLADLLQNIAEDEERTSAPLIIGGRNIRGAEQTVSGMVQNAITGLNVYQNSVVKRITATTTFTIDDSKPQAFFLIVPDEEKSKNGFISLFVSETYKELIAIAMSNEDSKLKRPLYYILDEFGNIPKIPDLDSMVTVSASRSIYFMFVLQSYKQINKIYGKEDSSVILGNCAYEFYLLTNEHETAEAFSKQLGEKEIKTSSSSTSTNERGSNTSKSTSTRTRRIMDANELMKLKDGEVIIRLQREHPIKTFLEPFWEYPKFVRGEAKMDLPKQTRGFEQKHTYMFVQSILSPKVKASGKALKEKEEKKVVSKETKAEDTKEVLDL